MLGLNLMDGGTSPSEAVARDEQRDRLRRAVGRLREEYREVLWLRHAEQMSFAEIAQVLGVTENAATVRYVRALQRAREYWGAADQTGGGA